MAKVASGGNISVRSKPAKMAAMAAAAKIISMAAMA